MSDNDKP